MGGGVVERWGGTMPFITTDASEPHSTILQNETSHQLKRKCGLKRRVVFGERLIYVANI